MIFFFSLALKLASWDSAAGRTHWDLYYLSRGSDDHACVTIHRSPPLASASEKPGRDQMLLITLQTLGMKSQSFALT